MNIIIEDADTRKFLTIDGSWTEKPVNGLSFASTRVACAAARKEPIGQFNVVGYFADTCQFINMDQGSGKGDGSAPDMT